MINLGLDMIARSLGGMNLHEVVHWLSPLGGDVAGKVVEGSPNLSQNRPRPPKHRQPLARRLPDAARHITGEHIPAAPDAACSRRCSASSPPRTAKPPQG